MAPPDTAASIDDSGTEPYAELFTPPGSDDQDALKVTNTALAKRLEHVLASMDTYPTVKVARNISARYALSLGRRIVDIRALIKDLPDTSSAHRENRYLLENILNNMYSCRQAVEDQSVVPHLFALQHRATDAPAEPAKVQLESSVVDMIAARSKWLHALKMGRAQTANPPSNKQRTIEELYHQPFSSFSEEDKTRVFLHQVQGGDSVTQQASASHNRKSSLKSMYPSDEANPTSMDAPMDMNQDETKGKPARKKWNTVKLSPVSSPGSAVLADVRALPRSSQLRALLRPYHMDPADLTISDRKAMLHSPDIAEQYESSVDASSCNGTVSKGPAWFFETPPPSSPTELSPRLPTFEQVRARMAAQKPQIDKHDCGDCRNWGCDQCKPDWFDSLLDHKPHKDCTCNGWGECFACTKQYEHPDGDDACDGAWGGCGSCAKCCAPRFSGNAVPIQHLEDVGHDTANSECARSITSKVTLKTHSQIGQAVPRSGEVRQNSFKESEGWCERCFNPATMASSDGVHLCASCDSDSHEQCAPNNRADGSVEDDNVLVLECLRCDMALEDHSVDCCPGCGEASGLQSHYYSSNSPRLNKSHRLKPAHHSVARKPSCLPESKPSDGLTQDSPCPVEDDWGNLRGTRAAGMDDALHDLVEAASRSTGYALNSNGGNDQNARTSTFDLGKGRTTNDKITPPDNEGLAKALTTMVDSWGTHKRQGRQWTTEMDQYLLGLKRGSTKRGWPIITDYMGVPRKACKKRYQALTRAERRIKSTRPKQDTGHVEKPSHIAVELPEDHTNEAEPQGWTFSSLAQKENCWGEAGAWSEGEPPEDGWCGNESTREHTPPNMSVQNDLDPSKTRVDEVQWHYTDDFKEHGPNCWCPECDRNDGGGATSTMQTADPTPKSYNVTYWATVECGDQTVHIPIDSSNVSGPEKLILDGTAKKVWQWVQEKGLGDKVGLKDAFDLAKVIAGDSEEEGQDVEGGCPLDVSCNSSVAGVPLTGEGDGWETCRSTPGARAESFRSDSFRGRCGWCGERSRNCQCAAKLRGA